MEHLFVALGFVHEHSLLARQDDAGTNTSETAGTLFCPMLVNTTGPSCAGVLTASYTIMILLTIAAVAAVIILSAIQRRVKLYPDVCWGYPGIATPVNLLGSTRFRFIYAIIFGIMSYWFFRVVITSPPQLWTPPDNRFANAILSTISRLIYVLFLTFFYYPLLATVDSSIPLIGLTIGALYSILWFAMELTQLSLEYTGCSSGCARGPIPFFILLLGSVPVLLSYIGVILWFVIRLVQEIYRLIKSSKPFLVKLREKPPLTYHDDRVRFLLKGTRVQNSSTTWRKVLNVVYPYDKSFQFPLRFLIAMSATFFIVVSMTTEMVLAAVTLSTAFGLLRTYVLNLYSGVNVTEFLETTLNVSAADASTVQEEYVDVIVNGLTGTLLGLAVIIPVATLLAVGFVYVTLFLMYRSVRGSIHAASQGDLSFLALKKPPLYRSLDASIKYIGFQVAYFLWSLLLYWLMATVGGIVLVLVMAFLVIVPSLILQYILPLVITFAWSQAIFWGQIALCFVLFTKKDDGFVYVHNRRLYNWVAYILLFQNAFVGLFSAVLRILKSALFGAIIVTRLDKVLYMKGFERFDSAYKTFVGFLTLELAVNNSVMHVFCKLLLERKKLCKEPSSVGDGESTKYCLLPEKASSPDHEKPSFHSRRAYNRWIKAYTLIRNPSLIETSGRKLEEKKLQSTLAFAEAAVEVVAM